MDIRSREIEDGKRYYLSAALFIAHFIVRKRMTTDLMKESIEWADKFLEEYSNGSRTH